MPGGSNAVLEVNSHNTGIYSGLSNAYKIYICYFNMFLEECSAKEQGSFMVILAVHSLTQICSCLSSLQVKG